ncbi:uncharacterized protein LOC127259658 isoform X2 [Andrographis paniculata]|uniref:uncharacterized protein LOC127259658 isoform X2 n=1 Tax=Andrographis paniculata TaxID=175694 RepID=UPI0021E9613C|nr:uncharacterized protein LOC127259658 isoform X2 [Andrographis paniculata]
MKEIVTIQVGNYANFVGSHFWNFQDELIGMADSPGSDEVFKSHGLNMDVLYRTGETQQGIPTYTPRMVSVDLQGSLGSVGSRGSLYNEAPETSTDNITWTGPVTIQTSQPIKKNLFLQSLHLEENENLGSSGGCDSSDNAFHTEIPDKDIVESLENEVQYWTDFSKVHYHPQSLYELSGMWMDLEEFKNYGIGKEAFSGVHTEEINERLRFFIEESDHPQGIQFIVDDFGGFSGLAAEFLENISDEYPNIPVLLYSVHAPDTCLGSQNRKMAISRKLHDAVSFAKLSSFCKMIVPIGLPSPSKMSKHLHLEDKKPYHTSAVYASAIHSVSLPFRMDTLGPSAQLSHTCGALSVNDLVQMLAGRDRQNMVVTLDVAMPAPALTAVQVQQSLLKQLQPISPEISDVEDMHALESMIIHGVFGSGSKRALVSQVQEAVQAAYLSAEERPKFSHLSVARCPLPIPLPFPTIFGNHVGQNGELLDAPISDSPSRGSLEVHSIPMAAKLRSSNGVLPFLENRLGSLGKFGIGRGALGAELLRSWGFGDEDVEDMVETLSNMVAKLKPEFEETSDSD